MYAVPLSHVSRNPLPLQARKVLADPVLQGSWRAGGFPQLIEQGAIDSNDETVVILTGTGLNATPFYEGLANAT